MRLVPTVLAQIKTYGVLNKLLGIVFRQNSFLPVSISFWELWPLRNTEFWGPRTVETSKAQLYGTEGIQRQPVSRTRVVPCRFDGRRTRPSGTENNASDNEKEKILRNPLEARYRCERSL